MERSFRGCWVYWPVRACDGKTVGVDASTLEANAAMRSIVRRDTGEAYNEFLTRLAKASGIETPTRADLARLDRKARSLGPAPRRRSRVKGTRPQAAGRGPTS